MNATDRANRRRIVHLTLISMAAAGALQGPAVFAGPPEAPSLVLVREAVGKKLPAETTALEVDPDAYAKMLGAGRVRVVDFPLPGSLQVDLELDSFELLAPGAQILIVGESGKRTAPRPSFRSFRGTVAGDPDSLVTLSLFDGRIAGFVRTWDDEYAIAPEQFNLARDGAQELRVRRKTDVTEEPDPIGCDGHDEMPADVRSDLTIFKNEAAAKAGAGIDENTLLLANIAIDTTYEWYAHFGSETAAQNYLLNIMAQVSTIFENEVKVQLQVPFLRMFTGAAADPYTDGSTSTSTLLADMRSHWNANLSSVTRTAAHLFSVRPSGGAGLAYLDVLCSNEAQPGFSYDYGVSTLSAAGGSWEKNLVAHEIGHNFDSPHTHCYAPEIDRCANESGCYSGTVQSSVGTIMSYCGQKTSTFHDRVKHERIRPAGEAAFPSCITTAGLPGGIDVAEGVQLDKPGQCADAALANDDGGANLYYGYLGTAQMAWIKRFTPACYPFRLTGVELIVGHASSVAPGRPVRVLVYTDPAGTGDPANASLVYSQDTTLQVVSLGTWNQYAVTTPVTLPSGDFYIGFYDLVADSGSTYIGTIDYSVVGDSFRTANSTSPGSYSLHPDGTWLIRAAGGAVGYDSLLMSWGQACNDDTTPGQDYAIYRGRIGDYTRYDSLTCTTGRQPAWLVSDAPDNSFFLIVPSTSANEGSYGRTSEGVERSPAAAACKLGGMEQCF